MRAFIARNPVLVLHRSQTMLRVSASHKAAWPHGFASHPPGTILRRCAKRAIKEAGAAPATPRKPSIQVSAPVSREAPAMSGNRQPSEWNTLSPEEVDIARRSIIDRPDMPRMTNVEKEWTYLQQRNRCRRMKASGEYSEQKE
jgi:hypothetical protein